ncbi:MAG: hypothetical protein KBF74_02260 [Ferruginibacter sp.]|nr:hypothetical protein [Ferruginibacter sp.]
MIIEIDDTKTIEAICKAFSARYPFLKIEFYDKPHQWQEASSANHQLAKTKTVASVRTRHNPGGLEISPGQKTGRIEQEFQKRFGLNIQIFRHHGNSWIQTVGTDEFTLEEQNEIGKNASYDMKHESTGNL